jgi:hypothetical protein
MKKSLFTYLKIIALSILILPYSLSSQNFQWVKWSPRPGIDSDFDNFNAVAVDDQGNSFLAVQFTGVLNIGNYSFQSNTIEDICILKYAPNGDFIWATSFGSIYWDQVNGMDCDEQGNVYLTGHYFGVLWYGNDSLVGNAGGREMYLMKISADGDFEWAVNGANVWDDDGRDVRAMPGGGVIMCGRAHDTGSIGNLQLNNPNILFQEFIAYFDDNGVGQWIRGTIPSVTVYSNSRLEIGPDSSIILAFSSNGEFEMNGDTIRPWHYPEFTINQDMVVQKYTSNGEPIWGWMGGSLGQDLFGGMTIDNLGRVYFTMNSPATSWFGQDSLQVTPGNWSCTVYRLNSDGTEDTAWHFQSTALSTLLTLASDVEGNVWVGGIMRDSLYTSFGTLYTPNVNGREALLYRINGANNLVDRYDRIKGQGWYSIWNLKYNNVAESLIFGGSGTASNAAPGTFGLGEDFVIGFASNAGNWAYIGSYSAATCETPEPLLVSDSLLCPGQTATISYPDNFYFPTWSNGSFEDQITLNSGAEVTFQAIDSSGCIVNLTASVVTASPVQFTAETTFITCNGFSDGAVDVTLTSGLEPMSYSWSNGQTTQDLENLSTGNYTLTAVSAQGCSRSQVYSVTQPLVINGILSESNGTLTIGSITGGTPPYTFTWDNFPGETGNTISFGNPGTYTVTITDSRGCTATKSIVATSSETVVKDNIKIFPNPATDVLKIEDLSGRDFNYTVYTVDGRILLSGSSVQGNTIALSDWPQGIYLLRVEGFTGKLMVKRFEVAH